jgi:4-aminobutyrate aminotransferase-like enzyme
VTIPGRKSRELAARLREREQRNVTFLAEDFPIFWSSARGAVVTDVDGNEYVDATAAFGVAGLGHGNAAVALAVADQAQRLIHGMGDVHPTEIRVRLLDRLAAILPSELTKAFLATSGSEAIEAALKTAMLKTGKSRFAAYRGGYHGLSFGALAVAGIERFRMPFEALLRHEPVLLDYPQAAADAAAAASAARELLAQHGDVAALVIEPIQGRGGCIVPPQGYLRHIRSICDELDIVLVVDEIFTGFARTGRWFAVEYEGIVPDIMCIGKAMGSGVPISAAVGRAEIMDAWPISTGEAQHTSTFLGNPLGCAAALATVDEMERLDLPGRAARLGQILGGRLGALRSHPLVGDVRGRGMLWGVELPDGASAFAAVKNALARGAIFSQSGADGNVIAISPPLVIDEEQLKHAVDVLESAIGAIV